MAGRKIGHACSGLRGRGQTLLSQDIGIGIERIVSLVKVTGKKSNVAKPVSELCL